MKSNTFLNPLVEGKEQEQDHIKLRNLLNAYLMFEISL